MVPSRMAATDSHPNRNQENGPRNEAGTSPCANAMTPLTFIRNQAFCRIPVSLLATFLMLLPPGLMPAQSPSWWQLRGALKLGNVPADDYAAINQGQLKNFVRAAAAEFDSNVSLGAGTIIHGMLAVWEQPTAQMDDYAAVNLGQLKAMAAPLYDRFAPGGMASAYPWDGSSSIAPDDFALANIGQAKNLFAFDLTKDANANGLPDWWEAKWGLVGISANDMAQGNATYLKKYQLGLNPKIADTDGDGVPDGSEIQNGTDPRDPYNGTRIAGIPAAPGNAIVSLTDDGGMEITWTNNANNHTGFAIFLNTSEGISYELGVVGAGQTFLPVSTVLSGRISVAAFNADGMSEETDAKDSAALPGGNRDYPPKPALTVQRYNRNKVHLTWRASASEGVYKNTDKIYLYRSTDYGPWEQISTAKSATLSTGWNDSAKPDHRYVYTAVVLRPSVRKATVGGIRKEFATQLPSYAAGYVSDYYKDIEIDFKITDDTWFFAGFLGAVGFIDDSHTEDSPPPPSYLWPTTGNQINQKGVIRTEDGVLSEGSVIGGNIITSNQYGFGSILDAEKIYRLKIILQGKNIIANFYLQILSPFADIAYISIPLSNSQAAWAQDVWTPDVPALQNKFYHPRGFDSATMPNALMVPSGGANDVKYNAGPNPPGGEDAKVSLKSLTGNFTVESTPPAPVDTSTDFEFYIGTHHHGQVGNGTLEANRPSGNYGKLDLVHMRALPKRVAVYIVRLVNFFGLPVKSGKQEIIGEADSNEVLEAGINGIYGKQANLTFLFAQKGTIDVKYSKFATAPTYPLNTDSGPWQAPFEAVARNSGADYTLFYLSDLMDNSGKKLLGQANRVSGSYAVIASKYFAKDGDRKVSRRILTVAHEIGHLLGLQHPWEIPQNSTDLIKYGSNLWKFPSPYQIRLMDYHNDAALLTRQEWEIVNPQKNR